MKFNFILFILLISIATVSMSGQSLLFAQVTWKTFNEPNGLFSIEIPSNWYPERVSEAEKLAPIDYIFRYEGIRDSFAWIELLISESRYFEAKDAAELLISEYRLYEDFRLLQDVECNTYTLNNVKACSFLSRQQLIDEEPRNVLNIVSITPEGIQTDVVFITSSDIYDTFFPVGNYSINSINISTNNVIKALNNQLTSDQLQQYDIVPQIPSSTQQQQQQQQQLNDSSNNLQDPFSLDQYLGQVTTSKSFYDSDSGISFNYSHNWIIPPKEYSDLYYYENMPKTINPIVRLFHDSFDGGSILFLLEKLPMQISSEKYYELNKQAIKEEPSMQTSGSGIPITIGNFNGFKFDLLVDGYPDKLTQIVFTKDTTGYVITYSLGSYNSKSQIEDIESMLKSFTIRQ